MNTTTTINKKNADSHCNHPSLVKEFVRGAPTGDLICKQYQCKLSFIIKSQSG